jgi:hypothetical protein
LILLMSLCSIVLRFIVLQNYIKLFIIGEFLKKMSAFIYVLAQFIAYLSVICVK